MPLRWASCRPLTPWSVLDALAVIARHNESAKETTRWAIAAAGDEL